MAKKSKPKPLQIPKDLKSSAIRKFKSKDRSTRILVVRMAQDQGYSIVAFSKKAGLVPIWNYAVPAKSGVPVPIWLEVQRELAVWYARQVSRGIAPDMNKEAGRRRRFMKRAMATWQAHTATKQVVDKLKGREPKPLPVSKPQISLPYLCFYNPMARKKDPVFHIHTAYCARLDQVRKRIHKKGGTSWVIEATGPLKAIALQVAEFNEEDKGYVASDFDVHSCAGRPKLVTSKTTLGRVMKMKRGEK